MPRERPRRRAPTPGPVAVRARASFRRAPSKSSGASQREVPDIRATLASTPLEPLQVALVVGVRGRLTIPRAMRRALALDPSGSLIAQLTPEGVLLRPALTFPISRCDVRQMRWAAGEDRFDSRPRRRRRGFN